MTHPDRFEAVYDACHPAIHQYAVRRLLWSHPGGGFSDERVPARRIEGDWLVGGTRARSSDTVDLYVVPGPGAGPAPDPKTISEPRWYDDVTG